MGEDTVMRAICSGYPNDPPFEDEPLRREIMSICCKDGLCEARVRPRLLRGCPLNHQWRWDKAIAARATDALKADEPKGSGQ